MEVSCDYLMVIIAILANLAYSTGNEETCDCENVKNVLIKEIFDLKLANDILVSRLEKVETALQDNPKAENEPQRLLALENKVTTIEAKVHDHDEYSRRHFQLKRIITKTMHSEKVQRRQSERNIEEGLKRINDSLKNFNAHMKTITIYTDFKNLINRTQDLMESKIVKLEKDIENISQDVSNKDADLNAIIDIVLLDQRATCVPNCTNGGVCFKSNNCRCKPLTQGEVCENFICEDNCYKNGGDCVGPGECKCPEGRSGRNCEQMDMPEINVRQTKYVSLVGETARLECYTDDASGRITLFWSRVSGLPPGSTQYSGVLTIPSVQQGYAGNYVCTGSDTETGRVKTAIAVLEVEIAGTGEAPTVRLEPERITIPMGTTGTLRCHVTGAPEPEVTWIKSREELAPNHQISTVNGYILRISNATMEDRGIFVCRAENEYGLDQDWTVVEVERRMRPKIDLYPNTTQRVTVGGNAMFQCRARDGDPPPTITWSRAGGAPMAAGRIETIDNGVIMFKQVTQAEQGGYICTAENDMGTTTTTASLIVEDDRSVNKDTRVVKAGDRVSMECIVTGTPLPTITWSRDDDPMPKDVILGDGILIIPRAKLEDTGTYICLAVNEAGSIRSVVALYVRAFIPKTQFRFDGDGFMEMSKDLLPHHALAQRYYISFSLHTTQHNGLIIWQGEPSGRPLRGGDYISIGLKGGYVAFSYDMGSGPAMITSKKRINDGKSHSISVQRRGRAGTLTVDDEGTVFGDSRGYLLMLNANGNIYIGGVSLPELMTDGKFTDNFIGCIENVIINLKGPLESKDAESVHNIQACTS